MAMTELYAKLDAMGANTQEGIARLMGKESLYIMLIKKFLEYTHFKEISESMASKDYETLLMYTHKLKGTTGNLSLTPLYERYNVIVADIRAENYDTLPEKVDEVLKLQKEFCEVLEQYL